MVIHYATFGKAMLIRHIFNDEYNSSRKFWYSFLSAICIDKRFFCKNSDIKGNNVYSS